MAKNKNNKGYIDPLERDPLMRQQLLSLRPYLTKKDIVEVRINQPKQVILTFNNGSREIVNDEDLSLHNLEMMSKVLANITGQTFSEKFPILSAKLPGGHRVQIVAYDAVQTQFAMSIRIQQNRRFSMDDFNIVPKEQKLLQNAVETAKTILVSGGTGTGKTSLTNCLVNLIPLDERIITIEGVSELIIPHRDWVALTYSENETSASGVDAAGLLRASMRLCPDRILLGEIHPENAHIFANAINTGHDGSIATIHANSPKAAIVAILAKMIIYGVDAGGIEILKNQLCEDIKGIVQIEIDKKTGKRIAYYQETETFINVDLTEDVEKQIEEDKRNA